MITLLSRPIARSLAPSPLSDVRSLLLALPSTSSSSSSILPGTASPSQVRHLTKRAKKNSNVGLSKEQRRKGALRKKLNLEKQSLKSELLELTKPDPVLGYRPGNKRQAGVNDEALWENCELRQCILSKDEVWGVKVDRRGNLVKVDSPRAQGTEMERLEAQELGGPTRLNFGFTVEDRLTLFEDLPKVTTEDRVVHETNTFSGGAGLSQTTGVTAEAAADLEMIEQQEAVSADRLARILDMRNASGKGIDVENKRRILLNFGDNGTDPGGVEAQVALMTYRLHLLHSHLAQTAFRKDNSTRRNMRQLVQKRATLLRYLKRKSQDRYDALLPRIGVHPRAVEGEIIVGGRPKLAVDAE